MSTPAFLILCFIILVVLIGYFSYKKTFKKYPAIPPPLLHNLLLEHVDFYRNLAPEKRKVFIQRVNHFIVDINIHSVDKEPVTTLDRVLIGASAIIPIFNFPDWKYKNISEVLLYPDRFNTRYQTQGELRNILGMVGTGAMHHTMLLSRKALREGFQQNSQSNTAIHEFVHLIDMTDGATDGVPEVLISKELVHPWLEALYTTIQEIKEDKAVIRKYAATNEAEFLSVVSEYFFLRPHFLEKEEPELYHLLNQIYNLATD